jgi:molybdopterin molybdotransferase
MNARYRSPDQPADVRMKGFARRVAVADAVGWVRSHARVLCSETAVLAQLAGRTLAQDVLSEVDVPGFDRSMMDGFAVQSNDTLGASPYNRLRLRVLGTILPGTRYSGVVGAGQAVKVMTGAAMPAGADAVLPVEQTEPVDGRASEIFAVGEVSPGKHVGRQGEDVACGQAVLAAGRRIRPQDVGVLSSIGVAQAAVTRRPRVRIVITGNELLPAGTRSAGTQITDANGPMLSALVSRDGGLPVDPGIVPDDPRAILAAMRADADLILVSGGSSVGQEDHAPALLAQHGELAIHGVAMRPSSPAGMGILDGRLVFLLPGNPVSCLCAYDFFAGRAIRMMSGLTEQWPYVERRLRLRRKLVSTVGRVDYARVKIVEGEVEPLAISGASILSSTTRADGFVVVSEDSEGFPAAAEVSVWLY